MPKIDCLVIVNMLAYCHDTIIVIILHCSMYLLLCVAIETGTSSPVLLFMQGPIKQVHSPININEFPVT